MSHLWQKTRPLFHLLLLVVLVALLVCSMGHVTDSSFLNTVRYVDHMTASVDGGPPQPVTLPHSFRELPPRTPVVLTAPICPQRGESVYIKSVYAPARIYAGDRFIYQFGVQNEYPDFMIDPATEVHIIELDGTGRPMTLRMEFLSPAARPTLTVHPPMLGTQKNLIFNVFHQLGLPLIFSMAQLLWGVALILMSLFILFLDKKGLLFFWLGLFSLTSGFWAFGENNFTGVVIKNPTLLYLLAFTGLFTFILPLLRFVETFVDFEDPRPLWGMEALFSVSAAAALLLQLSGRVACSQSMYLFHALLPPALVLLTALTVREYMKYKSKNAQRLILPVGVLALSALCELFNYQIPFTFVFSSLFQAGILFFLLVMGIIASLSIKDSVDLKNRQKELAFEQGLMQIQIKEQQSRSQILTQHEQLLRRQRHDLRHHLVVLQELAGDANPRLTAYLQSLSDQLPKAETGFCENSAVNAVLAHYHALCQRAGIELTLDVRVPPCKASGIQDSELCVVFGNLLENAVEACGRMTEGPRFIRLNSALRYDLLTITMDNSFNGKLTTEGGRFRSAKRDDFGIGLASIRSIAQKGHGDAEFKSEGNVFLSSVYLRMQ